ncbi:hypothetical protein B0H13DRAFT_1652914 [Mycena leptocephala]|nr:hypothetical protein B0H13DRAFT_1652914 [Mycena leptocephala]
MRIADLGWQEVSAETIANCWQKAGILPSALSPITAAIMDDLEKENKSKAEIALSQMLDELQSRGVLQKGNRLHLDDLVDMPEEQVVEDATDEEIFEAVQQMQSDREDMEINGSDDGNSGCQQMLKPTRKEALHAVATLRRYLEDEEGLFARKLKGGLAAFGQ